MGTALVRQGLYFVAVAIEACGGAATARAWGLIAFEMPDSTSPTASPRLGKSRTACPLRPLRVPRLLHAPRCRVLSIM
ncbi:hypothetical protein BDW75DRAFT_216283, partial [Aspergillus navahoensis]